MSDKSATERLRELLDEREAKWIEGNDPDTTAWYNGSYVARADEYDGQLLVERPMTPEQAIAATLGDERLAFLEEKVKRQGDYIVKLTKEKKALFAQNCEAATRYAGQMDRMQRKLEAATLGNDGVTTEYQRSNDGVAECETCELEVNTDMNAIRCSKCGYVVPKGTDLMGVRYCAGCGRKVVDE